ncbi:Type B diterpene cyclase [Thermoflexales bacterium]|nr:Type B diterpene cyclase [Thermoflexales bacterium]
MYDLNRDAGQLLSELDQPAMSVTAYDTAWLARVPDETDATRHDFPQALEWLRDQQHGDGCWGSQLVHYHDRVICTLNALIALAEYGTAAGDSDAIRRGEISLQHNTLHLARDAHETVGFELILPTLLKQAQSLDLNLPYAALQRYQGVREEKLRLIPHELLYSRRATTAHSLEFMGDELDFQCLDHLQEANGSLGHSPSATAYLVHKCQTNDAARKYLAQVSDLAGGAAMPAHPVEIFDTSWTLYNLELANYYASLNGVLTARLKALQEVWPEQGGVGFSHEYSVPDLDDTAVVFKLLARAGIALDPQVFQTYERDAHFVCYQFERNPSVGAHIHLLEALATCRRTADVDRMLTKALNFLHRSRVQNAYWFDKWHISPYYITGHAVIATLGFDRELARNAVDWMLATQRRDGSWGFFQPTVEETAYCLQALVAYHREVEPLDRAVLDRAAEFVYRHYREPNHPAMWIEKALYTPDHIIKSALIGALSMYEAIQ